MQLRGTVEHIVYCNEENGYHVVELLADQDLVTVVGDLGEVNEGEEVVVTGRFVTHAIFGFQFQADSCVVQLPETSRGILRYLSSGALPYIGPATAKKIVARFGDETLDVIANSPEKLTDIRGISGQKAKEISSEFHRRQGLREAILFLGQLGLSPARAMSVYRHLGPATVEAVTQNPYLLCGAPAWLRFAEVDAMAARQGLGPSSRVRDLAAFEYVLRHNLQNGHTCLPAHQLCATTATLTGSTPEQLAEALARILADGQLASVTYGSRQYIYLEDLWRAERGIAQTVRQMVRRPVQAPAGLQQSIRVLEQAQGIQYAEMQRQAIATALENRLMVLTGGPGTGKTTIVNAILSLFEQQLDRVALAAPTGRAAKRLSELTGRQAKTIHRLLEVDFSKGEDAVRFVHNESNPLRADVVIVDEMSMVDVKLFESLLAALRPSARLILVGDADQLPSVGPGNVLGELLRSGVVPTVRLTEIFRQAAKSLIVSNAHGIVEGKMPQQGGKTDDFFMLEAGGAACQQLVCDLVSTRLPRSYGLDPVRDIQVLCPSRKGLLGTEAMNGMLQQLLNPPGPGRSELRRGNRVWRKGDKVMQTCNDYDLQYERQDGENGAGVYNGDIGYIEQVDPSEPALRVRFDDRVVVYAAEQIEELEPAYAVTIHKSQGCEFPAVVIPVAETPQKLQYRNLLYTGVTRARSLCVLPGRRATVRAMVANDRHQLRYSCLARMLADET